MATGDATSIAAEWTMVRCPYCQHLMQVKGLNVGSFYVRCSGCAKQFPVTVPRANAEPVVGIASKAAAVIPVDPTSPGQPVMPPVERAPAPASAAVATRNPPAPNPHRMVEDLERLVRTFHDVPAVNLRVWAIRGVQIGTVAIVLLFAMFQLWWWVGGFIVCMILAGTLYEILGGLAGRSYLYKRAAALLFAGGWKDWIRLLIGIGLVLLAIVVLDLLPMAAMLVLLALGIAAGMTYGIDRAVAAERAGTLAESREMLKRMRLAGASEENIRKFICEFGGDGWEEFYEALFGYESKLQAREKWAKTLHGQERPEYASWRDPIAAWLNRRLEQLQQQQRDDKEPAPQAAPADASAKPAPALTPPKPTAEPDQVTQAHRMAEMMAQHAHQIAQDTIKRRDQATVPAPPLPPMPPVTEVTKSQAKDEPERQATRGHYLTRRYGGPLGIILAPALRFFIAAFLLTGFLMWRYDNRAALVAEVEQIRGQDMDQVMVLKPPTQTEANKLATAATEGDQPLRVQGVPDRLCDLTGSWPGGAAGLILLISSFIESSFCGLVMYGAAALALFGRELPLVQQILGARAQIASIIAGGALALLTMILKPRQH